LKILVTGSRGFIGKNLLENLNNIKEGKNKSRTGLFITDIYSYDRDNSSTFLDECCKNADFVFHLAGINRSENPSEFMQGNFGFTSKLLNLLKKHRNTCPVMLSSSIQASLIGRYEQSEYGTSKLAGEKLFLQYAKETGAKVLIYRFPNLFGKWCKPNYNSVVATFCNAMVNGLDYKVDNKSVKLELAYIDDLINEMLDALEGREHRCEYDGIVPIKSEDGKYCFIPITYKRTLGEIVDLLNDFKLGLSTNILPEFKQGSFEKKLYSTFLSYLPKHDIIYPVKMNKDNRGIFAELIKTKNHGQISVNIVSPGQIRGQHWHNSKWEIFIVVSGHGLVQERKIGLDDKGNRYPIIEYEVSGESMKAVRMLPGYTHNIINLSADEDLIMVIWANEQFDPLYPDTYFENVLPLDE
jgi:UDP-2-acetamido-2,6-beta-L-arabino-hexul-4-ose reductase